MKKFTYVLKHARTDGRTMDKGLSQYLTLSTLCSGELKTKAKSFSQTNIINNNKKQKKTVLKP